nr:MAG TPA: hypothetical protein [Caudoviricetes sp.]
MFGARASEWDEDIFYYRTGIALRMYNNGLFKSKI